MAIGERSIADVVQDIATNVESIVRSELRLAKTELMSQLRKIKVAIPILLMGMVAATLAMFFLSWTVIYALAIVLPMWGAALVVALLLTIVGGIALIVGINLVMRVQPPERTITSMKENVLWIKERAK